MARKSIILIGVGNIGKRTLQALLKLDLPADILAVEPDANARDAAKAACREIEGGLQGHAVTFVAMDDLPETADLAIIATSSKPRFGLLRDLLERCRPRALVLEKFLFQERAHYEQAAALMEARAIPCWVSCLRPVWPGYEWLAKRVGGQRGNLMTVSGGLWNLASNAVHILDCFARVSGEDIVSIDGGGLDAEVLRNKRAGYLEVSGQMIAQGANGGRVMIVSQKEPGLKLRVDWISPEGRYLIDEAARIVRYEAADTRWETVQRPFPTLMASELTPVYREILETGRCGLSSYGQSAPLHLALIDVLNAVFFPNEKADVPCPVT